MHGIYGFDSILFSFRVFVLDKVTDFLLLLGKLVIVGGVGVSSFYVFSGRIDVKYDLPQLNYYFVPIIIITISAYFIADVFFGVYEMGVDTLFLCFLEVVTLYSATNQFQCSFSIRTSRGIMAA